MAKTPRADLVAAAPAEDRTRRGHRYRTTSRSARGTSAASDTRPNAAASRAAEGRSESASGSDRSGNRASICAISELTRLAGSSQLAHFRRMK